jgi:hypothetical protein
MPVHQGLALLCILGAAITAETEIKFSAGFAIAALLLFGAHHVVMLLRFYMYFHGLPTQVETWEVRVEIVRLRLMCSKSFHHRNRPRVHPETVLERVIEAAEHFKKFTTE